MDSLLSALVESDLDTRVVEADPLAEEELLGVHDREFIAHTRETCERLDHDEEWFPEDLEREHSLDTSAPLLRSTHGCALAAAGCAAEAARRVLAGETIAYALCRPPGHHADRRHRGGVCYFNNAAVAADLLAARGRVGVIDLDLHYGNGSVAILGDRREVRVVSVHASTDVAYPFAGGEASPTSLPLGRGAGDEVFLAAVDEAVSRIAAFHPEHLVVSIGYDGHREDPDNDVLRLTDAAFSGAGARLAGCRMPIVLVQEGGYNAATIGALAIAFCRGLRR